MKYCTQRLKVQLLILVSMTGFGFNRSAAGSNEVVLYDFTASWCGPCQQMNPIVHKLSREGYPIQQVDIDKNPELARKYQVSSIPAFVMVVNGKETERFVGRTSESHLKQMFAAVNRQSPPDQPNDHIIVSPQNQTNPSGSYVNATGYERPVLGNPAPFPAAGKAVLPPKLELGQPQSLADASLPVPADYRIRNLAGAAPLRSRAGDAPVIRAQFDDNQGITKPAPHIDSKAANVRIRIRDEKGINYGSGTIIESRPGLSYVLTCGHIFRNISASSKVDVDIFTEDHFETFVGKVEKYDLDADVGLVSLPTSGSLPVARLAAPEYAVNKGNYVVSVGCSGGQPPTVESLQVTDLNRYTGPDNIECTGVPVQGRSGGGLFNEENDVIGVCIAADPKEQRGLYAGLAPVLEIVRSCGLQHLIRESTVSPAAIPANDFANQAQNSADAFAAMTQDSPWPTQPANDTHGSAQPANNSEWPTQPANNLSVTATPFSPDAASMSASNSNQNLQTLQQATGARLTIVIEDPSQPGQTRVVIIPAATARLIADLTGELQGLQTIAAHRTMVPQQRIPGPECQPKSMQGFESDSGILVQSPQRTLREEDRSFIQPTDFNAARPFRRPIR